MTKQNNFNRCLNAIRFRYRSNPEVFSEFKNIFLDKYQIKDCRSAFEEDPSKSSFLRYYRAVMDKKVSEVLKRNKGKVLSTMIYSLDYYPLYSEEQRKHFHKIAYELITHFEIGGFKEMLESLGDRRYGLAKRVFSSLASRNVSAVVDGGVWLIRDKKKAFEDYVQAYAHGSDSTPPGFDGM